MSTDTRPTPPRRAAPDTRLRRMAKWVGLGWREHTSHSHTTHSHTTHGHASRGRSRRSATDQDQPRSVEHVAPPTPGRRGWRGPGGGEVTVIDPAPEFRGTTVQVCGLWPFAAGSSTPPIGAPLGRHYYGRGAFCGDPISYFVRGLVLQPSAFVLGRPGLGKSTLVRRMLIWMIHCGVVPLVMADLKPDYVDLIAALGDAGDVIPINRAKDSVNPLDPGPILALLPQLRPEKRKQLMAEIRGRQCDALAALVSLARRRQVTGNESTIISCALRLWWERNPDAVIPPLVEDVQAIIDEAPPEVRAVVRDRGEDDRYQERTDGLMEGLIALGPDGQFGTMFCQHTSHPIKIGVPTVFDLSGIDDGDDAVLQAAAQATCWSYGASAVSAAKEASAAGLTPDFTYFLVMDELWRMLRAWGGMVDLVDAITRLNRQKHLGQVMISHTMNDLVLEDPTLTKRAWGFVERSEMVYLGGLADGEMGNLRQVFAMSEKETNLIREWSSVPEIDPDSGRAPAPPGMGSFLLKRGKSPAEPFITELTPTEFAVNDTNKRWATLHQG